MKIKLIVYKKGESIENCLEMLKKTLENAGHALTIEEINPKLKLKEQEYFKLEKVELLNTDYSAKDYDLIIFGVPIWSFAPSPVVTEYLQKMTDSEGKKFAIFIVCILPANVMRKLSSIIATKGGDVISTLTAQSLFEIKGNKTLIMKKFAEDLLNKLEPKPKAEKKRFKLKIDIKQIRLPEKGQIKLPKAPNFSNIKLPHVPHFNAIKLPKAPDFSNIKFPKLKREPKINGVKKPSKIKLPEFRFGKKKSENGGQKAETKSEEPEIKK